MRILFFIITIINLTPIFGSSNDLSNAEIGSRDPLNARDLANEFNREKKRKRAESETSNESNSSKSSNKMPTHQEIATLFAVNRDRITKFTPQELLFSVDWENLHEIYDIFAQNAGLATHMDPIRFPLRQNKKAALKIYFLYNQHGFEEYSYEWMFASYAFEALMGYTPQPELKIQEPLDQISRYSGRAACFSSLLQKNNLGKELSHPNSDAEMYRASYAYFEAKTAKEYGFTKAWDIIENTGYVMEKIAD